MKTVSMNFVTNSSTISFLLLTDCENENEYKMLTTMFETYYSIHQEKYKLAHLEWDVWDDKLLENAEKLQNINFYGNFTE